MREIFRYKGKHILYNTGEVEETPPEPEKEPAQEEETLSEDQMKVVLGSMSDNRITDSVKDLVAQVAEKDINENQLTEEQMKVVMGSMSDNRITDSVKELVDKM